MPVLVGPSAAVDLASQLSSELSSGRPGRATLGTKDQAFAWVAGLPDTIAAHVSSVVVEGLSFNAVRVSSSPTPAGKVAKGGTKPSATVIASEAVPLSKYAGLATFMIEDHVSTEALVTALSATMSADIVLAFDADCVTQLAADAGATASGADWAGATLAGIAAVASNGGRPSLLVLSAADYAEAVGSPGVGFALNPESAKVSLFGLQIVISPSAPAGTAFVLDPASCLAAESTSSPIAIADPYSGLSTNSIRLAVEAFLGFVVASPGGVASISVTP